MQDGELFKNRLRSLWIPYSRPPSYVKYSLKPVWTTFQQNYATNYVVYQYLYNKLIAGLRDVSMYWISHEINFFFTQFQKRQVLFYEFTRKILF